jgi:cyanophycinase
MRKEAFLSAVLILCGVAGLQAAEPMLASALTEPIQPLQGALVMVGGGGMPINIRDRFLELAGGRRARLVVIPTASMKADVPEQLRSFGYWKSQDVASCTLLHTRKCDQANDPTFIEPLKDATGVWLSGGDQMKLVSAYRGTLVERALHEVLIRGGVIGGTSAGAAVMSSVMITGGNPAASVDTGFSLLPGVVVDQHLMKRHRIPRLLSVLTSHPGYLGVGIDEQTAVVVHGRTLDVLGEATVRICFAASGMNPADVRILKPGDHADIVTLSRDAVTRARGLLAHEKTESTGGR